MQLILKLDHVNAVSVISAINSVLVTTSRLELKKDMMPEIIGCKSLHENVHWSLVNEASRHSGCHIVKCEFQLAKFTLNAIIYKCCEHLLASNVPCKVFFPVFNVFTFMITGLSLLITSLVMLSLLNALLY